MYYTMTPTHHIKCPKTKLVKYDIIYIEVDDNANNMLGTDSNPPSRSSG